MITETSELLAGYRLDRSGALTTLPWPTDQVEKDHVIRWSLGPSIIAWAEGRTDEPGLIHPLTGDAWRFTDGQKRFLILWWQLQPDGRYRFRSGVKRGAKGTGKDPFAAAWLNAELCGPSWFTGFDSDGRPVGERHRMPLVQIMSNSEAQSKDVLRVANAMWSRDAREFYGLDCGETRTILRDGGRMEVPPSSEASAEGDPATAVALNEALALDTPLPTPSGWVRMGDVTVGDRLFGRDGSPVTVSEVHPIQTGRKCYRVTFADGSSVVASDGHLWLAKKCTSREAGRVRTTEELAQGRFRVPRAGVAVSEDVQLPVDPYALGLWLGDGDARAPIVCAGADDIDEITRLVESRGLLTKRCDSRTPRIRLLVPGGRVGGRYDTNPVESFRGQLVTAGVLNDKHVPCIYLRAGTAQRLALLQGLMDSDGCITKDGFAVFVNDNDRIADAFMELARSLGQSPRRTWAPDSRSRKGGFHRICFTPRGLEPVKLPRKVARLKATGTEMSSWVTIESVVEVDSVPVRCIAVDSEDHLFLAGEGWSVTHNTHHMTESSGGHKVASVAMRNVGKSPAYIQARAIQFTNAHQQGSDSEGERSFEAWQHQVSGRSNGRADILYDSIEADPSLSLYDAEQLRRAISQAYSDAPWTDLERKFDEVMDSRTSVADAIRYYLNGLATAEDAWVEPAKFDALARADLHVAPGDQVALFLDCSKSGDATGLVGCRLSDGHVFVVDVWQPPKAMPKGRMWLVPREEVDAAVRETFDRLSVVWFGVDPSPATDDRDESLYWSALIDAWHRDFRNRVKVWATPGVRGNSVLFDMRLSQPGAVERNRAFTEMAGRTAKDIDEDASLTHDGSPALRVHVHNARRRPNQWGFSLGKINRDSRKLVDLAVCMVGARLGRKIALDSGKVRKTTATRARVVVMS